MNQTTTPRLVDADAVVAQCVKRANELESSPGRSGLVAQRLASARELRALALLVSALAAKDVKR